MLWSLWARLPESLAHVGATAYGGKRARATQPPDEIPRRGILRSGSGALSELPHGCEELAVMYNIVIESGTYYAQAV